MKTLKNAFDTSFEVVQSLTGGAISSYKDLSDFLGIKQPSVSGAKKRGKFPTEWANKLAGHYGFNPVQVFAEETGDAAIDMAGASEEPEDNYIGIPMSNGEISAGLGLEADNRFDFKLQFHKDWLASKGNSDDMSMIRVSGNSMEPTIQHGDVALINHAINHIDTPGAIYAISVDGQVSLKRLQAISETGKIKVISDNKDYDVDYVDPENMGKPFGWEGN